MGMFGALKKAKSALAGAKEAFSSDAMTGGDATSHGDDKKPDLFDRVFSKLDEKLDQGFEQLEAKMDDTIEAERTLNELYVRVASYRDSFTPLERIMDDAVDRLGKELEYMTVQNPRYGMASEERSNARDDLLASLAENESLPEEVRADIAQTFGQYGSVRPELAAKLERLSSVLPVRRSYTETDTARITWK